MVEEPARHYPNVSNKSMNEGDNSRIFYLKNFNNWMKTMLIQEAISLMSKEADFLVLDICCGNGGDLRKWHRADIDEIICVDVDEEAVETCQGRYLHTRDPRNNPNEVAISHFGATFLVVDCHEANLFERLPRRAMQFDIVSCQFSLHYAFRSEKALKQMMYNISGGLVKGGLFIGTIPDAEKIVHLLRKSGDGKYKNDVVSIEYIDKSVTNWSTFQPPLFGARIYFSLDEQVNSPEFLAYFPLLEEICKEFDLELVHVRNFSESLQIYEKGENNKQIMFKMKALEEYPFDDGRLNATRDLLAGYGQFQTEYAHVEKKRREMNSSSGRNNGCLGTLSKSEWEVVALYQTFIFRKI